MLSNQSTIKNDDTKRKFSSYGDPKKRVDPIRKTLAFLLASFQGQGVVVEMKDDSELYGIIDEVDKSTTVTLVNVTQVSKEGLTIEHDIIHVNGSSIRYVHLPRDVNSHIQLENYASVLSRLNHSMRPKQYKETESKRLRLEQETFSSSSSSS